MTKRLSILAFAGALGLLAAASLATAHVTPIPNGPPPYYPEASCQGQPPDGVALQGDNANDTINGTNQRDLLRGGGGNDTLNGQGANDCLYGQRGKDRASGGNGDDEIFGNGGRDIVNGQGGN